MSEDDDRLVRTADVEVRRVATDADLAAAAALLDGQELVLGGPLVDESERERLVAALASRSVDPAWRAVIALRGDEVVGYAGAMVPGVATGLAVGDVAPARVPGAWAGIVPALLAGLEALLGDEAAGLQVWVRFVSMGDLAPAVAAGYRVERRLGVLGRELDDRDATARSSEAVTIRAYRPDADDVAVVGVLSAAYDGTGEAGWDLDRFARRRRLPWFRAEDLLVAEDPQGELLGLHWLKRRDQITGEVYNLAVRPDAQRRGLGPVLLSAGLARLREIGCTQVMLWVDRANERAASLYELGGFETLWDDVALVHEFPVRNGP